MYKRCLRAAAIWGVLISSWCLTVSAGRSNSGNLLGSGGNSPFSSQDLEAVTPSDLSVSLAAPATVQPGAEWVVTTTVTNTGTQTLNSIGIQVHKIPGLQVLSVSAGTVDSACCSNHVISGVAAELAAGGHVDVTIHFRAATPGIWPVGVQVFNESNDPAEPGVEQFVYAEPPGGLPAPPNFAVPFPYVEFSSERFEWVAFTGRTVVFLSPFSLVPHGPIPFPDVETGFRVTQDGNFAWAIMRGGDVARLNFSNGAVDLRFPVPLALAANRGSIVSPPGDSKQLIAFGVDIQLKPRAIAYNNGVALAEDYSAGLFGPAEPYRSAASFQHIYVAAGSQLRELNLGATGLVEARNLDSVGRPGNFLEVDSDLLFNGPDTAVDLTTLNIIPTGALAPHFVFDIGYGFEPGGPGNVQIRAFDALRRAVLWRLLIPTEEVTELVSAGFFGVLLRGPHGGFLPTPSNPGVDLTLTATLPSPNAQVDDVVSVPIVITKGSTWSALGSRLTAEFSAGVSAITPQSSSNKWVLPLGVIDHGTNLTVSFKITQPGVQSVSLRVESDFTDSNPDDNIVTLVWNNSTGTQLILNDTVVVDDGQPYTFHLTAPAAEAFDVKFHLDLLTALPSDVTGTNFTLHFPIGATSASVPMVAQDDLVEGAELFRIIIDSIPAPPTHPSALVTISNDDRLDVTASDVVTPEGNSGAHTVSISLALSAPAPIPISVQYATTALTATAGVDFEATSGEIVFAPGQQTGQVDIKIFGDTDGEPDEKFQLTLLSTGAVSAPAIMPIVTISDDDAVHLLADSVQVTEGNTGSKVITIPVKLDMAVGTPVVVSYSTTAGTATANVDFESASGEITFAPGETTNKIELRVIGDTILEADETFQLNLNPAANVIPPAEMPVITIQNDDTVRVLVGDTRTPEGDSGTKTVTIPVVLESAAEVPVEISYSLHPGSALSGIDYVASTGTVKFDIGQKNGSLSVGIIGDGDVEQDESFTVDLTADARVVLPAVAPKVTILNDDEGGGGPKPVTIRVRPGIVGPPVFEFDSVVGTTYTTQTRASLETGNWQTVGEARPGTGAVLDFTASAAVPEAYFRVLAQ